ncbi:MAG: 50S ribosomal protein L11 methyltransferase [Alphaproteobacteria bacterium]|nr:50S ribosomal protein L11 methyltransferase [Alphaproteobacteria bacterium]
MPSSTPPEQTDYWQATIDVPVAAVSRVEAALVDLALVLSDFDIAGRSERRLQALFDAPPDRATLDHALAGFDFTLTPVKARDWVAESQRLHTPIDAGRFHVHGSHRPSRPGRARHAIQIDAGQAFGTGQHATTFGCLLALDRLARGRRYRRVLDLGCGAGILSLAMARCWPVRVTAADNDPVAIQVTRDNVRQNALGPRIDAQTCADDGRPVLGRGRHYDLIVANILARPLIGLAGAVTGSLTAGGDLVLSGLLVEQEAAVFAAYRARGLRLKQRLPRAGWTTLIVGR